MIKKILGICPQLESDGSYRPSKLALKLGSPIKTNAENISYQKYDGARKKIVALFTEQKNLVMQNGKKFSTGNHPVESLVPMLHLRNAGFDIEIVTLTGKPVVLEMWAFPQEGEDVREIYDAYQNQFENPKKLGDVLQDIRNNHHQYAAVFVPGGHGAMLGIPEDHNVGEILRLARTHSIFTISICHGPAAFLATALDDQSFLYDGYEMAVFPDAVDRIMPKIGYLPGRMVRGLSERLRGHGAKIINTRADATVCRDRDLLTGASPLASNDLGKLAAETLIGELS